MQRLVEEGVVFDRMSPSYFGKRLGRGFAEMENLYTKNEVSRKKRIEG